MKQIVTLPSNRTMLFYSRMTRCFGLKRPSSGHHYKICNIRYNAVQIMFVIWDPVLRTGPIQYKLYIKLYKNRGTGSVVGIATGYWLDGPGIESRWEARFSAPVQTGPGAHPASCTMGTGSCPEVKSGRGVTLTPHPLLVPWS